MTHCAVSPEIAADCSCDVERDMGGRAVDVAGAENENPRPAAAEWEETLRRLNLVVVVPAYNEERKVEATFRSVPGFVRTIVVVEEASPIRSSDEAGNPLHSTCANEQADNR